MDENGAKKLWIPWSCNVENSLLQVCRAQLWLEVSNILILMIDRATISHRCAENPGVPSCRPIVELSLSWIVLEDTTI